MGRQSGILPRTILLGAALGLCVAAACAAPSPAAAQQVVARVNGDPITAVDLAQRTRLMQLSGDNKAPSRQEALNELIEENLKMQAARRYRVEIPDSEVDQIVANMAARMRANTQQFTQMLGASGVSINALKRKLRADLAWSNIVRGKFQASLQVRDKDITNALMARRKGEALVSYDYTLRPILLVVPRGADSGAVEARRREAEGLRSRFQNCDDGLRLVQGLREVVVRPPIVRGSGDLSAKLREVIDAIPVGRLTPPDVTPSGVEVFAICDKKAGKGSAGAERDMREELFGEQFQTKGRQYLRELRRSAKIEIR